MMPPEPYKIYSMTNLGSRLAPRLRVRGRRDCGFQFVTGGSIAFRRLGLQDRQHNSPGGELTGVGAAEDRGAPCPFASEIGMLAYRPLPKIRALLAGRGI